MKDNVVTFNRKNIEYYLFEDYLGDKHRTLSLLKKIYYEVKPIIPRKLQIFLRRIYAKKVQTKYKFIDWPIETFLVDEFKSHFNVNFDRIFETLWPNNFKYAFLITHDVDTKIGFKYIPKLVELEKKLGFVSSYNIVPYQYEVDKSLILWLLREGYEIGVHGYNHDGKLFWNLETFVSRVTKINEIIKEWNVEGFRSPATHRNWLWMQLLEIKYDSSFSDTDIYEPMPGGCFSIWPFRMGKFIELPYTLPQDHTLFQILRKKDIEIWKQKFQFLKDNYGLILVNIHPDYLDKNYHYIEEFYYWVKENMDSTCWHTLPKNVAKRFVEHLEEVHSTLQKLLFEVTPKQFKIIKKFLSEIRLRYEEK